jgi:hypothetical protein
VRFGEAGSIEVKEEPEVLLRNARETGGEDW